MAKKVKSIRTTGGNLGLKVWRGILRQWQQRVSRPARSMTEQEEHQHQLATLGLNPEAARRLAELVDQVKRTGRGHHAEIPGYMEHPLRVRQAVGDWLGARGLTVTISGESPDGRYLVELEKTAR